MKILTLVHDSDIECPNEHGGWKLYSFGRHHTTYKDPSCFLPASIGLRRKLECGTAFMLSYYEHGACRWSLQGEGPQCRWDTVDVAGILLWEGGKPTDVGKDYEARRKSAQGFLEVFTCWANGEGYGFSIEEEKLLPCGHTEIEPVDSCFGFYGNDVAYMLDQIREHIGDEPVKVAGDAAYLADHPNFKNEVINA